MSDSSSLSDLSRRERRYLLQANLDELRHSSGGSVVMESQGRLFKATIAGVYAEKTVKGGQGSKRGVVGGFSAKSRKRLLEQLARLDHERAGKVPFLTLTYPAHFPTPKRAKEHLRAWLKRLAARYPGCSAVWRLELQKRGAPHFHLLLFNVPFVPMEWVQSSWAEVIGCPGVPVFTRIELMRSWRGVMWYASKYIAKEGGGVPGPVAPYVVEVPALPDDGRVWVSVAVDERSGGFNSLPYLAVTFDHVGRWWGVFQADNLPYASSERVTVPFGDWFYKVKALGALVWSCVNTRQGNGFTLFLDDPRAFSGYARTMAGVACA